MGGWGVERYPRLCTVCVYVRVVVGYALSAGDVAYVASEQLCAVARQRGRLSCVPPPPLRVPPGVGWSVARGV